MPCRWYCMCIMVIFSTQCPFALSTILSQPMNTVAVARSRVKMECRRHPHVFPVDWEFAPAGSSNFSYVYTSERITESLSSKYRIDTDNRSRYDVVIDFVDLSQAGTYRCTPITEEVVNLSSYSAEITVLASEPVCGNNASALNDSFVEGDYIAMWCAISYLGNYYPFMEWTVSTETAIDADVFYTNATTVTSSLTIQLNSRNNGVTFTCKMSFKPNSTKIIRTRKNIEILATNAPRYQVLWNLTLDVLYGPRNLTVTNLGMSCLMNDVYEVGDHIVCFADGNPPPTHEWMDTETNRTINGSVLTVDDKMRSDKNHNFKCTAYNTVAGDRKQIDKTITFTVKGKSQLSTVQSIIISTIAVGAVCCLILTLFLCNNRCPYKRVLGLARPEPDILQAVQINPYYIAESLEDHPEDQIGQRSVQAGHSPVLQSANSQHHPFPVYGKVQRKENNGDSRSVAEGATGYLPKQKGLPVYAEVMKNRNGSKPPRSPRQTAEAGASQYRPPPSKTNPGADGTQYLDVTSIRDLNARAPIKHPPMFSLVETYASIDHTVNAPPPPLPPKRQ